MWITLTDADTSTDVDINFDHLRMFRAIDDALIDEFSPLDIPSKYIGMTFLYFGNGSYLVVEETQSHIQVILYGLRKQYEQTKNNLYFNSYIPKPNGR